MAELHGSKRTAERATYTPIKLRRDRPVEGRAWDKWSYVAALSLRPQEVRQIAQRFPNANENERQHLATLQNLIEGSDETPTLPFESVEKFRDIPETLLQRIGDELLGIRKQALDEAAAVQAQLLAARAQASSEQQTPSSAQAAAITPRHVLDSELTPPGFPDARVYRLSETIETPTSVAGREAAGEQERQRVGKIARGARTIQQPTIRESIVMVRPQRSAARVETRQSGALPSLDELLQLAPQLGVNAAPLVQTMQQMTTFNGELTPASFLAISRMEVERIREINQYFRARREIEPVGLLHLERLNFIPAGIERGELMHSVPLSPGEEVNISHKEWSNTSEEFQRIVSDFLEAYSEEGVTEKSELSQSTNSQNQHSSGFNMSVTASGGYGPVSVSSAFGYNVAESSNRSEQVARQQSSEVTRKAASRVRKEHKVSFKVASAAGTEDQAVRKIKNPFDDKATRIDFYQLVRKWQVDLHRYGVRLTYDLTIPEPGSDILSKIIELNTLRGLLQEGFNTSKTGPAWAQFKLVPDDIDRGNYEARAAEFGVSIEPPPAETIVIPKSFSRNWPDPDHTEYGQFISFEVEIPEGYEIWSLTWGTSGWKFDESGAGHQLKTDFNKWIGASGRLTLAVSVKYMAALDIELNINAGLKDAMFQAWQMRAWNTLREAALARYEMRRALIKERLARLQEEIGGQDPLSLRKNEREEVMKGVLRWLFGPSFSFVAPGLPANVYGSDQSVLTDSIWSHVLAQGEITKFLHHAIEWENMTYFLYPYFWSHTARWELKKYLDHPDFLHRAFLKAGAARVVLTVRPGFEREFVEFVESGGFHKPGEPNAYVTIAQEIEAHARTNYPGIRSANPVPQARPLLSPLQRRAWVEMEAIIGRIEQFKTANARYPTTVEGLAALAPFGAVPAADPWGNAYEYRSPGKATDFELWSQGADGAEGGVGDDADITSWAEASLIARWFDYTPTSALDIAFNETMPTA